MPIRKINKYLSTSNRNYVGNGNYKRRGRTEQEYKVF